jgi:hypothetical protein
MPRSKSEAEALERLRERLQATQDAAQRLAEEARAATAGDPGRPPAAGWDVPRHADETSSELEMLVSLLGTLRDVLPPELRAQLAELVKALLVFVRTALDFAISQLELAAAPPGDEPEVEDIPIG